MAKKPHIGKMISDAAYKSGYKISKISKLVGVSRTTVYNDFAKEHLDNDTILKYGRALGIDFSEQLPELIEYTILKNDPASYATQNQYREKYYQLLEKHISIIDELNLLKNALEESTSKKPAPSVPSASKVRQKKPLK